MLTRMTDEMVAMAWLCGISSVRHHLWTENNTLYSYETPIGIVFEYSNTLHAIVTGNRYSATTSKHLRAAERAIRSWQGIQHHSTTGNLEQFKTELIRSFTRQVLQQIELR